jgi:methylated-DNA-[protein]-cysteine S-methyltransferase
MDHVMIERSARYDADLLPLVRTLTRARKHEKIPVSQRRLSVRARLVQSIAETKLRVVETKIGWIGLAWSARGLVSLELPRSTRAAAERILQRGYPNGVWVDGAPANMLRELKEYAEGRRHAFELPLDWESIKPFQRAVLKATSTIPFGETRSYGWVAHKIGKPRAFRAVGHALATNPIPIILPCHRVIGSDGGLHGYGGGLPMKAMLLKLEGAVLG